MNEQISAFMDGEASEPEGERTVKLLKVDHGARQEWLAYHVIGDVLRETPYRNDRVVANIAERISAEPTVLAPRKRAKVQPLAVWSAAASVTAVALAGWLLFNANIDRVAPNMVAQPSLPVPQLATYVAPAVTPYVAAHQEFSKTSAFGGMTLRVSAPAQQDAIR